MLGGCLKYQEWVDQGGLLTEISMIAEGPSGYAAMMAGVNLTDDYVLDDSDYDGRLGTCTFTTFTNSKTRDSVKIEIA